MKKIISLFSIILLFLSSAEFAYSASLSFSPSSGQYQVGKNFSVTFLANADGQAMNASSGTITFPTNTLEVVSLSKTGSIFSLWVQEPTFSNTAGTINFEGVVLNPGYSGNSGKLLTVTFRPKAPGSAQLKFSSGSILANDGTGTNIASTLSTANFTITDAAPQPKPETPKQSSSLVISSTTHPNQNNWYNLTEATFNWELQKGVLETKLLLGRNKDGTPTVSYIPPISTKTVEDLEEGVYYFSVQTRTAEGWSSVGRFKLNIDTTPPEDFNVTVDDTNGTPKFTFEANDTVSGISHYEIKVGDKEPVRIEEQKVSGYIIEGAPSGKQDVTITAFDKAGNKTTKTVSATFLQESITKPIITEYPEKIEQGQIITIQGKGLPDSSLTINISRKDRVVFTQEGKADSGGNFSFVVGSHFSLGYHTVIVQAGGEDSEVQSNPIAIKIEPAKLLGFAIAFVSYLGIAILVVAGLALFIKIILFFTKDLRKNLTFVKENKEKVSIKKVKTSKVIPETQPKRRLKKSSNLLK
jgi:hypothetical protein